MHKFLQSACTHCASVLDKTTNMIRAKGEVMKNGVNIFTYTPEPQPQSIGNTALVTPKLTAESDMQNRYETPVGYTEGSSGSGSEFSGSTTGYHGLASGSTGMDVLSPHPNLPGESVERWAPYVCDAIVANGLAVDDNRVSRILRQIETESSGDPGAIQGIGFRSLCHRLCHWRMGFQCYQSMAAVGFCHSLSDAARLLDVFSKRNCQRCRTASFWQYDWYFSAHHAYWHHYQCQTTCGTMAYYCRLSRRSCRHDWFGLCYRSIFHAS